MGQLFKKAAVFTDIHFGKKSDSEQHNKDCLAYLDWFCEQTVANGCDTIIFCGDWFDNRSRLRVDTNWYASEGISKLVATGLPIYWVIGNHDLYFKTSRDIHSLPFLYENYASIKIIDKIELIDDVLFCPWLIGTESALPQTFKSKYVFGHFEFPLFLMNESVECPDHGGIHMDFFHLCEYVFSGHFHKRQIKINAHGIPVAYLGNAFSHDFNDAGDTDRGCMILEWDKEPVYLNWEEGPRYLRIPLSKLIEVIESDSFDKIVNDRSVVECNDDMKIDHDTSLEIKEVVQNVVRDLRLKPADDILDVEAETEVEGDEMTVEQMVLEHLTVLDTEGSDIENATLIKIFEISKEKKQ